MYSLCNWQLSILIGFWFDCIINAINLSRWSVFAFIDRHNRVWVEKTNLGCVSWEPTLRKYGRAIAICTPYLLIHFPFYFIFIISTLTYPGFKNHTPLLPLQLIVFWIFFPSIDWYHSSIMCPIKITLLLLVTILRPPLLQQIYLYIPFMHIHITVIFNSPAYSWKHPRYTYI